MADGVTTLLQGLRFRYQISLLNIVTGQAGGVSCRANNLSALKVGNNLPKLSSTTTFSIKSFPFSLFNRVFSLSSCRSSSEIFQRPKSTPKPIRHWRATSKCIEICSKFSFEKFIYASLFCVSCLNMASKIMRPRASSKTPINGTIDHYTG